MGVPYDVAAIEARWRARWADDAPARGRPGRHRPVRRALQPGRVPVPVGRGPAHRPRDDVCRRGHVGSVPTDARPRRVPADRLRQLRHQRRELRVAGRAASGRADRRDRRQLPPAARAPGRGLDVERRRSPRATPRTTAGRNGCSCACSTPGLAYQAEAPVLWCPCARRCWRGSRWRTAPASAAARPSSERVMRQWFLRMTALRRPAGRRASTTWTGRPRPRTASGRGSADVATTAGRTGCTTG